MNGMQSNEPLWAPPTANTVQPLPPAAYPVSNWPTSQTMVARSMTGSAGLTDRREANAGVVTIAWILAVGTLGYMLPWAIAATRGRANQGAIGLVDLLVGWTVVGWIAALVMACQAHQPISHGGNMTMVVSQNFVANPAGPPAGWYPSPWATGQQYWDGTGWSDNFAP